MNHPPKYNRTYHWPWSQTVHQDDSYHQNPEFFVNKDVVISEKLDGSNTALFNGNVYGRSTSGISRDGWRGLVWKHQAFKTLGETNFVFYGEDLSAKHSIDYSVTEDQTYSVFGILDIETNSWLSWDDLVLVSAQYNFNTVPLLFRGQFTSVKEITTWFETELKKESKFGSNREGFVIRNINGFKKDDFALNVAKYVRANHVQTIDKHWTKNWQWNNIFKENNG